MPVMIGNNFATELCITRGQKGYVCGWQSTLGSKNQWLLDTLFVKLKDPPKAIKFNDLPGNVVPIQKTSTSTEVSLPNDTKIRIIRSQMEVFLDFSMTDYALQGKTRPFNLVNLHNLRTHQAYYTALSRSSSADGTLILQGFDPSKITGKISGAWCYGSGSRRSTGKRAEADRNTLEELQSGREAEGLGFNLCVAPLCTQCPISESRSDRKGNRGNRSRYSDWRYRRKQLSIYTNYVFHLEQVRKDGEWGTYIK